MKNIVRAFVAILVLSQNKVTVAKVSMLPIPSCAPDDPNACGLGTTR
jgi:hypothetical protein